MDQYIVMTDQRIIDRIKDKIQLSDWVRNDTKLTKQGKEYVGNCPFHQEKTGSFFVNDEKNSFYCFGCGASGDIFQYVMQKEGINFALALKKLADYAHIDLPAMASCFRANGMYHVLQCALDYFQLPQNMDLAREYMRSRTLAFGDEFQIGFAPETAGLYQYLVMQKCETNDIEKSGLFRFGSNQEPLPRFRGRIMFPIFDTKNRPIAFGGRSVANIQPKYLNSPETEIFQKHQTLYALNIAQNYVTKDRMLIIVEGYIDVYRMHKFGFNTTIATLGTALSSDHLTKMWKYSTEPIICLDGDKAGEKAMVRVAKLALPLLRPGYSLKFCSLPSGEDPDSFLTTNSAEAMQRILDAASPLSEFLWQHFADALPEQTPEKKALWEKEIFEILDTITDISIKKLYKSEFNEKIYQLHRSKRYRRQGTVISARQLTQKNDLSESLIFYILLARPAITQFIVEDLSRISFSDPELTMLRDAIIEWGDVSTLPGRYAGVLEAVRLRCASLFRITDSQSDEQLVKEWRQVFLHVNTIPQERAELESAKNLFKTDMTRASWERLQAMKLYSLTPSGRTRVMDESGK